MFELSGGIDYFSISNMKTILLNYIYTQNFLLQRPNGFEYIFLKSVTHSLPAIIKHTDCFNFNWLSCQLISSQQWGNCLLMFLIFCYNIFVAD